MLALPKLDKEDKAIMAQLNDKTFKNVETEITYSGKLNIWVVINRLHYLGCVVFSPDHNCVRKSTSREVLDKLQRIN